MLNRSQPGSVAVAAATSAPASPSTSAPTSTLAPAPAPLPALPAAMTEMETSENEATVSGKEKVGTLNMENREVKIHEQDDIALSAWNKASTTDERARQDGMDEERSALVICTDDEDEDEEMNYVNKHIWDSDESMKYG